MMKKKYFVKIPKVLRGGRNWSVFLATFHNYSIAFFDFPSLIMLKGWFKMCLASSTKKTIIFGSGFFNLAVGYGNH